jgi:hypothetical protein
MPNWTAARYRRARDILVGRKIWVVLKKGGNGPRDPYEFGFADRSPVPAKGARIRPNTNKTPLSLSGGSASASAPSQNRKAA